MDPSVRTVIELSFRVLEDERAVLVRRPTGTDRLEYAAMSNQNVEVQRVQFGPIERIALIADDALKPAMQSVYRIGDTLIDTAGSRVAHALVEALRATPPRRVLLTHQHEDHVGGVGALRRAFGQIPVYVARSYLPILSTDPQLPEYRARYWGEPELIHDAIGFDPGHVFELAELRLQTVETPGHTPFHISFIGGNADVTYALTGDLFTTSKPSMAWFESAAEDTARSCRTVAASGSNLQLLPTHGRTRANGRETLLELAAFMEQNIAQVLKAAERLATRDYKRIALEVFGEWDAPMVELSQNEYGFENFVRSVLDPVRSLPATRLPMPGP
jgi:glyoxylase-like metal-dependent hydrolase (beta-lactamase superfamily II)